jgi:hypothetical protein
MKRVICNTIIAVDVVVVALLNLVGCAGAFYAHGFWGGWTQISEWYSPWNFYTLIVNSVLVSPALLALWWRERAGRAHSSPSERGTTDPLDRYIEILAESDRQTWLWRKREAWLPVPIPELKRLLMAEMLAYKSMANAHPDVRAAIEERLFPNLPADHNSDLRVYLEHLKVAYLNLADYDPLMTDAQEKLLNEAWKLLKDTSRDEKNMDQNIREIRDGKSFAFYLQYLKESHKRTFQLWNDLVEAGLSEPWTAEVERKAKAELEKRWGFKLS